MGATVGLLCSRLMSRCRLVGGVGTVNSLERRISPLSSTGLLKAKPNQTPTHRGETHPPCVGGHNPTEHFVFVFKERQNHFFLDKQGNIMYNFCMKKTQTGKNLTRLNITLPTDLWEWLKSQGKKGNVSASYFLARLVEREKIIAEITEKRQK